MELRRKTSLTGGGHSTGLPPSDSFGARRGLIVQTSAIAMGGLIANGADRF
jgi:hypothetical protein